MMATSWSSWPGSRKAGSPGGSSCRCLPQTYRIIAPDLPGQGDSDRPFGGYDTQTLATKVHGLLQQLGIRQYSLVAHDVGAWVAYPYAALFGDEVRRLVLMDAGIPGITLPDALPTAPDRAWRTWHFAFHACRTCRRC